MEAEASAGNSGQLSQLRAPFPVNELEMRKALSIDFEPLHQAKRLPKRGPECHSGALRHALLPSTLAVRHCWRIAGRDCLDAAVDGGLGWFDQCDVMAVDCVNPALSA
jgi:hypothetical protein